MRRSFLAFWVIWIFLFVTAGVAHATIFESVYGDQDGFILAGDEGITDIQWLSGTKYWTHDYNISGLGGVQSASLELNISMPEAFAGVSLALFISKDANNNINSFDNQLAGIGTFVNNGLYSFDLDVTYFNDLNGTIYITMLDWDEGGYSQWALDYSKLTIALSGNSAVPEPATMLLLVLGVMGIAGARSKFES